MLARVQRLTGRIEETFFLTSHLWGMTWARIYWQFEPTDQAKFAIIVPKKNLILSTTRHRAKRLMSQAVRETVQKSPWPAGSYVVVARPYVVGVTKEQMLEDLAQFQELKLTEQSPENCGKIEEIETKAESL